MEENRYWRAMSARYEVLTGDKPQADSDVGIRFAALAWELQALEERLAELERQSMPQTATGPALERHAAQRGLQRKGAAKAVGVLCFRRTSPAPEEILIPAGTVCATAGEPVLRYLTTRDATLPAGAREVDAPAEAEQGGSAYNAAAGRVCAMVTPVGFVAAVENPQPFAGGSDAEGDEALRRRLTESYMTVSNGTNAAFYRRAALQQEGVHSVNVLPRARGVGTVDVVLGGFGAPAQPQVVAALQARLQAQKEVNVDLRVEAAAAKAVEVGLSIQCAANQPAEQLAAAAKACAEGVLQQLGVGQPLRVAKLTQQVMNLYGVENCQVLLPQADVPAGERELLVAGALSVVTQ